MAAGSAQLALSTTAARLADHPCNMVTVYNDDASIACLIGGVSGTQLAKIPPLTNSGPLQVRNTNQVFIKSASGTPTISYFWV